jgi:hypothetical protein
MHGVEYTKLFVCITETNQLMLYREAISLCCGNHTQHRNIPWGGGGSVRFFNVNVVVREEASGL